MPPGRVAGRQAPCPTTRVGVDDIALILSSLKPPDSHTTALLYLHLCDVGTSRRGGWFKPNPISVSHFFHDEKLNATKHFQFLEQLSIIAISSTGEIKILRGPASTGSGAASTLRSRSLLPQNLNEYTIQLLFRELFPTLLPPTIILSSCPLVSANLHADLWLLDTLTRSHIPVEVKLHDFDDAALRQLSDYMLEYRSPRGIAVATSLSVNLPDSVLYVEYDARAHRFTVEKPWTSPLAPDPILPAFDPTPTISLISPLTN